MSTEPTEDGQPEEDTRLYYGHETAFGVTYRPATRDLLFEFSVIRGMGGQDFAVELGIERARLLGSALLECLEAAGYDRRTAFDL